MATTHMRRRVWERMLNAVDVVNGMGAVCAEYRARTNFVLRLLATRGVQTQTRFLKTVKINRQRYVRACAHPCEK